MRIQEAHQRRGVDEDIERVICLEEGVDTVDPDHDDPIAPSDMERGRKRKIITVSSRAWLADSGRSATRRGVTDNFSMPYFPSFGDGRELKSDAGTRRLFVEFIGRNRSSKIQDRGSDRHCQELPRYGGLWGIQATQNEDMVGIQECK